MLLLWAGYGNLPTSQRQESFFVGEETVAVTGCFIPDIQSFDRDGGYSLAQLFNCDETGLNMYYKLLLQQSLAAHIEKSATGCNTPKECVTINIGSNATGKIKVPLL